VKKILKLIAGNLLALVLMLVVLELASAAVIASKIVKLPGNSRQLLTGHFPEQLRPLDTRQQREVFGEWVKAKPVAVIEAPAGPVIDYTDKELGEVRPLNIEAYHNGKILRVEWSTQPIHKYLTDFSDKYDTHTFKKISEFFAALKAEVKPSTKVVVATGSSTTAFTVNWPFFFSQDAHEAGMDVVVVNLAEGNWTVRNYDDYFRLWHKRLHDSIGRNPDLLLSLDGTTDLT
jgi:hypothetical protein